MIQDPTDPAPDLAMLRQERPGWFFCTIRAGDRRLIAASRHGVKVADFTAEAVRVKIQLEEDRADLAAMVTDFGDRYQVFGPPWLAVDRLRLDRPEITAETAAELREALAVLCPPRP